MLGSLIAAFLVEWLWTDEHSEAVAGIIAAVLKAVTTPVSFAWASAFTYYFQGVALIVAVVAIMFNGVRIFGDNGSSDESVGHYVWRSLWPVALIAGCPAIFSTMTSLVARVTSDLTGSTALEAATVKKLIDFFVASQANDALKIIWAVGALIVTYYTVTILFQCVKRQVQLAVLSVVGPLVAASTVSTSSSGDFLQVIKEMLGIGVTTSLQVTLLMTAIELPTADASINPFLVVALFASIKQLPKWIERYTLAPAVAGGGGAGRLMVLTAARTIGRKV